jgi:hypothetical protein
MEGAATPLQEVKQEFVPDFKVEKKRRTIDRFNGTPKEELMKRSLPDIIKPGLDILIIGEKFEDPRLNIDTDNTPF